MSWMGRSLGILCALVLVGVTVLLLPVVRAEPPAVQVGEPDPSTPEGDPGAAEYWRYCAIDGYLADCCGGTHTTCPPGTEMSAVTWLGTCTNPADGKDYVISYNDCCGKPLCGRCFVRRIEGERPAYVTHKNNDINWCMGTSSIAYNSTVAVVVGVTASEQSEVSDPGAGEK